MPYVLTFKHCTLDQYAPLVTWTRGYDEHPAPSFVILNGSIQFSKREQPSLHVPACRRESLQSSHSKTFHPRDLPPHPPGAPTRKESVPATQYACTSLHTAHRRLESKDPSSRAYTRTAS